MSFRPSNDLLAPATNVREGKNGTLIMEVGQGPEEVFPFVRGLSTVNIEECHEEFLRRIVVTLASNETCQI